MKSIITAMVWSPPLFWLFLSIPAAPLVLDLWRQDLYYAETMYVTGIYSVQLLVLTLCVTPVVRVLRHWSVGRHIGRWLLPRRRYLGVASAGYAFLHTAHYVRHEWDVLHIIYEAFEIAFLTGWIAVFLFIPLVVTSNAFWVRRLGRNWKRLQRGVYIAAAGAFFHWFLLDQRSHDIYIWLGLLTAAKLIHAVMLQKPKTRGVTSG